MSTTVQEQALAALKSTLDGLAGVTVYRTRDAAIAEERMPAVNMLDGGWEITQRNVGQVLWLQRVDLECFVTADTDAELGPAVTSLTGQVLTVALADPTLGDVTQDVRAERGDDPIVGQQRGQRPVAAFTIGLELAFWTRELDPYTSAP